MIDAGIQHPTACHAADPMFSTLWRWAKSDLADNGRCVSGVQRLRLYLSPRGRQSGQRCHRRRFCP
jgi:hypothetical protein